jgi:hypothetical protein
MTKNLPATKTIDERFQKLVDKALYAGGRPSAQKIRDFLNGTWLGEPLHVVLTDIPNRCRLALQQAFHNQLALRIQHRHRDGLGARPCRYTFPDS